MTIKANVTPKGLLPTGPAPQQEQTGDTHPCDGTLKIECCCPPQARLYTQTFSQSIGPQTEAQLAAFIAATTTAWEAGNFLVLAHSLVDTGAGWYLALTIGWYA